MSIFLVLIAAVFGTLSNFCMRKSIDVGSSAKAFLVIQLLFSFLAVFFLTTVPSGDFTWDIRASGIGIPAGVILGIMMWTIGRALEKGPSGLTFAAFNSASIMPAILMAIFFGISCGHVYTFWNAIGSLCVILGLFWAGFSDKKEDRKSFWIIFASLAFLLHVFYITFMQWRVLLLNPAYQNKRLIPFCIEGIPSQWFMPLIFLTASFIQIVIFIFSKQHFPSKKVIMWGLLGGIANGANLFFLILATEKAAVLEKAMLFPISSVTTIILCNAWAQAIYKEKINWLANLLCIFGLAIGTINWNALF